MKTPQNENSFELKLVQMDLVKIKLVLMKTSLKHVQIQTCPVKSS